MLAFVSDALMIFGVVLTETELAPRRGRPQTEGCGEGLRFPNQAVGGCLSIGSGKVGPTAFAFTASTTPLPVSTSAGARL